MSDITVYYLEMTDPAQHQAGASTSALNVTESRVAQGKVNRFLYDLVGEPWQWFDKQRWTLEQWEFYVASDNLKTFIGYVEGSIAGYFELNKKGADVEIAYFGLAPAFTGQGLGGPFLSEAINHAWAWTETRRVILNTCSLDHPSALGNYQKRGFSVYKQETVEQQAG